MTKVMVFGTFDILHLGHILFLKNAKKYGDHLSVVIARDKNVKKVKGKKPIFSEIDRQKMLKELRLVDEVLLGNKKDVYKIILQKKPNIIVLGYDQRKFVDGLMAMLNKKKLEIKVIRVNKHLEGLNKSSKIKKYITELI